MPGQSPLLIALTALFLLVNLGALGAWIAIYFQPVRSPATAKIAAFIRTGFVYELLCIGALVMLVPFYWMVLTSFKDQQTSTSFPPEWTPAVSRSFVDHPETGERVVIRPLEVARVEGQEIRVAPADAVSFQRVRGEGFTIMREIADESRVFSVPADRIQSSIVTRIDPMNYMRAWFAPEEATRGAVNFGRYFWISFITGVITTAGTLFTGALAAFAFARMQFPGKGWFFYIVLLTMMVPGEVLLIPNFYTLSMLNWLDTLAGLTVPFLASVFTIFLMRQFFMTIPDALWDAAQIDGASRFRFLWQVVAPLSKPVFMTAGIFTFLGNWNALLWPLIVTNSPEMRTLMVGLQTFSVEAGDEFHLLMAASTMAVLPIVILFFLMQKFFIAGIARTGLK